MGWPQEYDICFDKNRTVTHNTDVDGPGVVASFISTSWFTLLIVLCNYLFVFDSTLHPFRRNKLQPQPRSQQSPTNNTDEPIWTSNSLDRLIGQLSSTILIPIKTGVTFILPSWLVTWLKDLAAREQTEDAFTKCVLSFCDVQLITGISMLLSGFLSLLGEPSNMPLADWRMIINLAWFSNLTHQCGLIFLRGYLYQNPSERLWRLLFMTILLLMLITAMVPTVFAVEFDSHFGPQPSTPARCFFNEDVRNALYEEGNINKDPIYNTGPFQISTVSIIILFLSFVTRLVKLFETSSRFVHNKIRARIGRCLRKVLSYLVKIRHVSRGHNSKFKARVVFLENPLLAGYMFLRIFADIYASVLSDVTWVLLSAISGTKQLASQRASIQQSDNNISDFGQILPIGMLVAALLTLRQSFMSGRVQSFLTPPTAGSLDLSKAKDSRIASIGSTSSSIPITLFSNGTEDSQTSSTTCTLDSNPSAISKVEQLLSHDSYTGAIWLLPTLLNVGAAIFLFFELIASSGGGNALGLFVSMLYSFAVVSLACCAVILVGLTMDEYQYGKLWTGLFALQPLGAIIWLTRSVMAHTVYFGEMDQAVGMIILFLIAASVLVLEYAGLCFIVDRLPNLKLPRRLMIWHTSRSQVPTSPA